jgi:flagellar basal-body rod protein FlgF
MPGGSYIALSGMRTRLETLDRIASDIANASTVGYKLERSSTVQADRPSFGAELQSAIDVTNGPSRVDIRSGSVASTGRDLDLAIEGSGFLTLDTPAGPRYTRNGHLLRRADGVLASADGNPVRGTDGPITTTSDNVQIDTDGTVRNDGAVVGKLKIVEFDQNAALARESALRFRNDGTAPKNVEQPSVKSGALEQSNVSVVERVAELTSVSREFETLQRAVGLINDIDSRAIAELGRR